MDQTKYVAETQEDFWTGNLLLKVRAPREKGAQTRMLDFGWGKFRPYSECAPIPFIIIPAEAQEEVIGELIRVLSERKKVLAEDQGENYDQTGKD
jgi:hypothetical protein